MRTPAPGPAAPHSAASTVLLVPGLDNSGPGHWQTHWEAAEPGFARIDLGMWDRPHRNTWVNKLNHAVLAAPGPVTLVAHSLGCLAVAWWAALERPDRQFVHGALLVAPPEVDFFPLDERLTAFAPTPFDALPFPSILIASRNDPWAGIATASMLARAWGSEFVDAGAIGHINAESNVGEWRFGRDQLDRIVQSPDPEAVIVPAARNDRGDGGRRHSQAR